MSNATSRRPDISELNIREAFMIVGIICGFMIVCVFLRLFCNIAIDMCVMCNMEAARLTLSSWKDHFFPCFRRRLVNPHVELSEQRQESATRNLFSMLSGLSPVHQLQIIESLIPVQVSITLFSLRSHITLPTHHVLLLFLLPLHYYQQIVLSNDLEQWKERTVDVSSRQSGNKSDESISDNTTHAITCSICIHDIVVGDEAFISKPCNHVFHRDCILEWIKANHTDCPFCRASIIDTADVDHAMTEHHTREMEQYNQ